MNDRILALLAGSLVLATTSTISLGDLAAHFRFNDTLTDETGQHNATMVGTPEFNTGQEGSALSISTADSILSLANPQSLDFGKDFTVAAWVQTTHPGEQVLIYRGDPAHFAGPALQVNIQGPKFFVYGNDQGSFGASYTNLSVNDGAWHHVAVAYSAAAQPHFTLYLDANPTRPGDPGAFFAGDFVTKTNQPDSVVRIGGRDTESPDYHFRGLLDEVQLYNRTLTADQIQFLFQNPASVVQPPAIPAILTQPQTNVTAAVGGTVTLSVVAEALTPPTYQWQFNGKDVAGATKATLTLTNLTVQQAGTYTVKVSTAAGSTTSGPAVLTVGGAPELSVHMYAGITIAGISGLTYRLEYQDALAQPTNWLTWTNISLTTNSALVFDVQSTNAPKRFYRAVVSTP